MKMQYRFSWALVAVLMSSGVVLAQDVPPVVVPQPNFHGEPEVMEEQVCPAPPMGQPFRYPNDTWTSWWFRRYAGSVEMREKAFYPPGYAGDYYFRPWKPDWVYPLPPAPVRNVEPWHEARQPSRYGEGKTRTAVKPPAMKNR